MNEEQRRTTIRLRRSLQVAARIKALQLDTNLSDVIRRFLQAWVDDEIELPEREEEGPEE